MTEDEAALQIRIKGVVQGVGFRPFVHRLARRFGLSGWVRNEWGSVRVLAQGSRSGLNDFLEALSAEAPPLARIDDVNSEEVALGAPGPFQVLPSSVDGGGRLPVSPDVAICALCLEELGDTSNRRYRYPFITCTDCGPRFTVIEKMPYDRDRTSMAAFTQCPDCETEYRDPEDRRYHSQTNSCPSCGPRIWFEEAGSNTEEAPGPGPPRRLHDPEAVASAGTDGALQAAARLLETGGILAVRGLGGFHLAVDATNEAAVARLRHRKGREAKPLAVMVADLEAARRTGHVGAEEERLLTSPERPIVLLRKRPGSPLSSSVSPGLDTVGVVTAYTPLHHLLLQAAGRPLVMTSGNLTDEPIATGNQEARDRLGRVADGFLLHDREIVTRYDDSVVRVAGTQTVILRRARGYAPLPLSLPLPIPAPSSLLGVGPHLKNTFTLASQDTAYMSQHIGDLDNLETLGHFQDALDRFRLLFRTDPAIVVRDCHPGYLSTRLAHELAQTWDSEPVMEVQHHHAHVAAVLAEHGEVGPALGVALDGTGFGDDGTIWGGEILVADLLSYRRVGRLRQSPLPGGESAIRQPWRTAMGYLSLEPQREPDFQLAFESVTELERRIVREQARRGLNAPLASSMGRLFDAAACVLGVRSEVHYEGQAAMEMEALAGPFPSFERRETTSAADGLILPFPAAKDPFGTWILDPLPLLSALGSMRREGIPLEKLAGAFHDAVVRTFGDVVSLVGRAEGLGTVALGGGVFQNAHVLSGLKEALEEMGFRVLVPRLLSPNDSAISYGQVAVAAARLQRGRPGTLEGSGACPTDGHQKGG